MPISLSSASATYALIAPIATARIEMVMVRGVTVKSPSLFDARSVRFTSVAAIGPPNYRLERVDKRRAILAQLRQVAGGEFLQLRLSTWSELDQHLPPVSWRSRAQNQAAVHQPVHQFDRAVMLDLEPLGQHADARLVLASHGKQQLVLMRLESRSPRCLLAEVQKPANVVTNLRQASVVFVCNII